MIRFIFSTLLMAVSLSSSFCQLATPGENEKMFKDFRKQTEEWKTAYNSRNSQNLLPLYSEDAQYISGHVNGLVADGRNNILKYLQDGINAGGYIDSIDLIKVTISCDIATLLCRYQATNSGVTVNGRNLLVMKKVKGKWLIYQHITVV